jgi:hypothetical protein
LVDLKTVQKHEDDFAKSESSPHGGEAKNAFADQIVFARHVFDNYQALIRSVDTKAGALLALAVFFGASSFPVSKDAIQHIGFLTRLLQFTSAAFLISSAIFCLLFLVLVVVLGRVIQPRGARFYKHPNKAVDLLWQEHVVLHQDNGSYFSAVSKSAAPVLLRNLTDQVFELASISKEKMDAINTGFGVVYWLAFSWIMNVTTGLILLGWKK